MLSGEYFVLDGALALAIPTQYGQTLHLTPLSKAEPLLHWQSKDEQGQPWFEGTYYLADFSIRQATDTAVAERLSDLLKAVRQQRPNFLLTSPALSITTQLDFPRNWGLGSSSTLIAAIAKWADVDPYALLSATFGGSGYDLACAMANGPIFFQRKAENPHFVDFPYHPPFTDQLYFVYLGKKQNSREGIARYRAMTGNGKHAAIAQITQLTAAFAQAQQLKELESVISEHERLVSSILQLERAKSLYFPDYWGAVKSLGAWGGDFVLVTSARSAEATRQYFQERGFEFVLGYEEMVKGSPFADDKATMRGPSTDYRLPN